MTTPPQPPFDFPVLDAPRTEATRSCGRVVLDFLGYIEPRIDETDYWCNMPVRLTHTVAGFALEVGPYDLDAADIRKLREAIASYDQAIGRGK
jgi:hypothetical protein